MRLTKFNIPQRYTASDALQHPWITRINKTLIPLTLPDKMNRMELENKFRNKISLIFFTSIVKVKNQKDGEFFTLNMGEAASTNAKSN